MSMQATVVAFAAEAGSGSVLLDDGVLLTFTADALAGSGLRLLRLGQRVKLETTGTGAALSVARLQIITLA